MPSALCGQKIIQEISKVGDEGPKKFGALGFLVVEL